MRRLLISFVIGLAIVASPLVLSAESNDAGFEFFEKRIRPLLDARCLECHNEENVESELRLDSLGWMLEGGTRGPAIVPGKPDESLLIRAVNHGELLKMPPKEKLATRDIKDLESWIEMGAPWPNSKPVVVKMEKNDGPLFSRDDRNYWAFQTPIDPILPQANDFAWPQLPLDRFVLAKLEDAGMKPAPRAEKHILIRRAAFDLTGLPPTPDEVSEFLADDSPDAFARLVDRLLASPAYGERWGRHWLDIARYGDSNGLDENLAHANAFRYRDYVVAAFNKDKPFDRFVQEQLAGDLLQCDDIDARHEALTATGFLVLGAKMLAEDDPVKMQMDIIDEQIDVVGKAFMGLTLGCARCHDHKFDPIPQADYYSLAGIFKSTKTMENHNVVARWQEIPLATTEAVRVRGEHQKQIDDLQTRVDKIIGDENERILRIARGHIADYLTAAVAQFQRNEWLKTAKSYGADDSLRSQADVRIIEAENYDRGNVTKNDTSYGQGIGVLVNRGELPNFAEYDIEFSQADVYQFELRYAAAGSRPCKVFVNGGLVKSDAAGQVTGSWNPHGQKWFVEGFFEFQKGKNTIRLEQPTFFPHIDKLLFAPADANKLTTNRAEPSDGYVLIPELVNNWVVYFEKTSSEADSSISRWRDRTADTTFSELELEQARKIAAETDGPFKLAENAESHYSAATVAELKATRQELKTLQDSLPQFPQTMAVSDATIEDIRLHIRGNHITQGDVVPRRMLRIIAGEDQDPIDSQSSGRLQLAKWLTQSDHPLTARVMANRIWGWHFGAGLVGSPDNFGRLGQRPTHPELLDYLAVRFIRTGWSIKDMHRTLMQSSTYQMSTALNPRAMDGDPDNQLLWRMNRRRMEAEVVRDSVLAICGSLDRTIGGTLLPTENRKYVTSTANVNPVVYEPTRRAIYLPVVRSALYDVFQAFDFAEPSVLNGQRSSTTIASQALFMMNSRLVSEQTQQLAEQLLTKTDCDDSSRLSTLYQQCFGRTPTPDEALRDLDFVEKYAAALQARGKTLHESRLLAWQSICRAVIASNEFIYIE